MPINWADLSWEEKREYRFKQWLSPVGINFPTTEIKQLYTQRVKRYIQAIKREIPDRVPVFLPAANFAAAYAGGGLKRVMYDYDALREAWLKFLNDFEMDTFLGPGSALPGKVLEIIDCKLNKWPGHGLADNVSTRQFVEKEYCPPVSITSLLMIRRTG